MGQRIRVTAQLINAATGHHVWADRYDRDLADVFELQDELTHRIAATVSPELEVVEAKSTSVRAPEDLDAWDLVQRGNFHLNEFTNEGIRKAREMFEAAIDMDPDYSRAYVGLAYAYLRELSQGTAESFDETVAACGEAARRAVALDDSDSDAHQMLSIACYREGDHDRSVGESERAVDLNPSSSWALTGLGLHYAMSGRPEEGVLWLERGLRLNPREPRHGPWLSYLALAHYTAGSYAEAVECSRKAIQRQPNAPHSHLVLAASLGQLDLVEAAAAALSACEEARTGYTTDPKFWHSYKSAADQDRFLDGLRKAGLAV